MPFASKQRHKGRRRQFTIQDLLLAKTGHRAMGSMQTQTKSRWFRFSLRSLLILLTAFTIWLGWHVHRSREQHRGVSEVRQLGGTVFYSFQLSENGRFDPDGKPRIPAWLWGWLGEDFIWPVVSIDLRGDEVSNEDLVCLERFQNVTRLILYCPALSDEAMTHVAELKGLRMLHLSDTGISNDGVATLDSLEQLGFLQLSGTGVDDNSIEDIARLTSLHQVMLERTGVTESGVEKLRELRPDLSYYLSEEHTKRQRQK